MHAIRCLVFFVSVTKCPVAFLVPGKKYGQVMVMKCPLNYNPWRDINTRHKHNRNLSLKDNPNTNTNLEGTMRCFTPRLSRTFHDVYQNWACISLCAFLDITGHLSISPMSQDCKRLIVGWLCLYDTISVHKWEIVALWIARVATCNRVNGSKTSQKFHHCCMMTKRQNSLKQFFFSVSSFAENCTATEMPELCVTTH